MKYFLNILFIAIITFSIILINSCCDDPELINPHPGFTDTLFQSQEFLDYWYFKEGSWWVYKRTDTTADIYDTAFVKKAWKKFIFSKYAMPYAIERYYMDVYHNAESFTEKGYYGCNIKYESNQQGMLSVNYGGGYWGGRNFFWWPVEFKDIGFTIISDSNSQILSSTKFYNCIHIRQYSGDFWISKDFGLIKIESFDGERWELINYKLYKNK